MNWSNPPDSIEPYLGFIYIIYDRHTHKDYIGQKKFWFKKTLQPLKGMKRKRRSLVESDWKEYCSSSKELQADIEKLGKNRFTFKILHLCYNKAEMNYLELKEQVERKCMLRDDCYNGIIQVRIAKRGLDRLKGDNCGNKCKK